MKIATVLSVSAVFALTSLVAAVGCSAPAAESSKSSESNQTEDKGDANDAKSSSSSSGSTPNKAGTTTTNKAGTTTTTNTGGADQCLACVGATSKAGLAVKCQEACKDDDDACFEKCDTDNCGADGAACEADFTKCEDKCGGGAPTAEQEQKFQACIAKNPKAKAYIDCLDATKCDAQDCDDKCWDDSKCDEQCGTDLDKCDAEAAGG